MKFMLFTVFFLIPVSWAFAGPKERVTTGDLLSKSCSDQVVDEKIITSCDEEVPVQSDMMQQGVSDYCIGCKEQMQEEYSLTQTGAQTSGENS